MPNKFYLIGTHVEVVNIDMNGLHGRDPHPPAAAEGRMGQIIGFPREERSDDYTLILYPVHIPGLGEFWFADYELN